MILSSKAPMDSPRHASAFAQAGEGPRVLMVLARLDDGEAERAAVEAAARLTAAGGRAVVASAGGTLENRLRAAGGELARMDLAALTPLGARKRAKALVGLGRRMKAQAVHALGRVGAWSAWSAARALGAPFIATYAGAPAESAWLMRRLDEEALLSGDPLLAPSDYVARRAIRRDPRAEGRLIVTPRGVDLAIFNEAMVAPERVARLAERWRLDDDPRPILLAPLRAARPEGWETLIEAAARLRKKAGPVFMVAITPDEAPPAALTAEIDKRITARRLSDCVFLGDPAPDRPAAYLMAAGVLALSARPEAFARAAVEAQAMGRPVIAFDHGAAREAVTPGASGWLAKPNDAAALAAAMAEFLAMDASQRAHMGLAGMGRAHALYGLERMRNTMLRVYEQAAARAPS